MTRHARHRSFASVARCGCVAVALCGCLLADGTSHAADRGISVAEQRVFLDDQLRGVRTPSVLRYAFKRSGVPSDSFEDRVVLRVDPHKSGKRSADVSYLSGEHRITLPALDDVKANPIILYFLEQDVRDMHRRLGGSENYFRRRIRLALAESADVTAVTARVDGKPVSAIEVAVRPFVGDPLQDRLGPYVAKRYAFTLSDRVPGGVIELRTSVPAAPSATTTDGAPPSLEDRLSFEGLEQ